VQFLRWARPIYNIVALRKGVDMSKWDMLAVIIALVTSGMVNVIAIRRNIVLERQLWESKRRWVKSLTPTERGYGS